MDSLIPSEEEECEAQRRELRQRVIAAHKARISQLAAGTPTFLAMMPPEHRAIVLRAAADALEAG